MSIYKVPYKLEVWEDEYDYSTRLWKEKRSVCLSTNDMEYIGKAYDIVFTRNVNGENTLAFSLVGNYTDSLTGNKVHNYLVDYVYNEVKIKLQYDDKWYDFIVKEVNEQHDTQLYYTYSCKYLPIIELSKIGYDIQFSLDDSTGSAIQRAPDFIKNTIKNTDWDYIEAGSAECVKELSLDLTEIRREIAYSGELDRAIRFYQFKIENGQLIKESSFFSKGKIYIPYSQINKHGEIFVGLDNSSDVYDNLIDRYQIYIVKNPLLTDLQPTQYQIEVPHKSPSSDYIYYSDPINTYNSINQYCQKAKLEDGTIIYYRLITQIVDKGYFKTKDQYPVVQHIIQSYDSVNQSSFQFYYDGKYYIFSLPNGLVTNQNDVIEFYLGNNEEGYLIYNKDWDNKLGGAIGQERPDSTLKIFAGSEKTYYVLQKNANGTIDYIPYVNLVDFNFTFENNQDSFYELNTDLFTDISANDNLVYSTYQFFKVYRDSLGKIENIEILGYSNVLDNYYYKQVSENEIGYYNFNTKTAEYELSGEGGEYIRVNYINEESYEMYRTIEVSKSNCFNITQQVAETFNIWCRYIIEHEPDGRIAIDENTGKRKKWITLTNTYGQINKVGFTYGLNTNSITRNVITQDLITKLYVEYSENNAAKDGFVAIQYAKDNLSGENTIYNFDYYIQKGLLDGAAVSIDLYKIENEGYYPLKYLAPDYIPDEDIIDIDQEIEEKYLGYIEGNSNGPGFLRHLGLLNKAYDNIYEVILGNGETSLTTLLVSYKTYRDAYEIASSSDGSISDTKEEDLEKVQYYTELIESVQKKLKYYNSLLQLIVKRKQQITKAFNQIYSRFIQEGNWSSNQYINHDDYYADSLKVALDSSKPRAEYTINAINLYALPQYKEFNYEIGDITYIEDVEYFGYNNNGTPYHEKVIISQISNTLDMPINDTFTISNYSNKFEDIFQTLAATAQSYSLNESIFQRAAHISANGNISSNVLTSTFNGVKDITLMNNDVITYDNYGLKLTNAAEKNKILRIMSGGLMISNDGGKTYSTGIYDGKINTSLLQSGQLNVEHIHVASTGSPGAIILTGDKIRMYSIKKDDYLNSEGVIAEGYGDNFNIDSLFKVSVDTVPDPSKIYYIKQDGDYISVNTSLKLDNNITYYEYIGTNNSYARELIISPNEGFRLRAGNEDKIFFDSEGNLTLAGVIIAEGGEIGGFNIGMYSLGSLNNVTGVSSGIRIVNNNIISDLNNGYCFWAGASDGNPESAPFWVKTDGSIKAQKISLALGQDSGVTSTVGGWDISANKIYTDTNIIASSGIVNGTVGESTKSDWRLLFNSNFGVDKDGILYANNSIITNSNIKNSTVEGYCTSSQYEALVQRVAALESK